MKTLRTTIFLCNLKTSLILATLLTGLFFLSATTASGSTVTLGAHTIPAGGSVSTKFFRVKAPGRFRIRVTLKTMTLAGMFGSETTYQVQLLRENVVVSTRTRTLNESVAGASEPVFINYNLTNCNNTGRYRIRISNISANPQKGNAYIPPFEIPDLQPAAVGNLPEFSISRRAIVNRAIPAGLQPSGSGGTMKITATWNGSCLPNPKGCILRFRLMRNGTIISSDSGYSSNSFLAGASEKMAVNFHVQPNLVQGNWSLQVRGSTEANVSNVRTTVSFSPACQN